jgi:NAD(P)-dependent dehydrogenase (short-subunit alcohol dehydrogenase family)
MSSFVRPEWFRRSVSDSVVFLVSEDAKNITGQSLNVDGGMVMA